VTIAVVAEKPAVARDLAHVLGASARGTGCLHGGGYVVTWAIGHLVGLAEPHEIDERWRRWRLSDLPILPAAWPLVVLEGTRDQFEVVRAILSDPRVDQVVCATDAGREGELIFRYVYEAARCTKPVKRLWLSSLTEDAIARGFRELKDARAFDALGRAARARSRADWLVGMNCSRAYSVAHDEMFSVGRVQTPTLAMVVARELEIRAFVPEDYLEIAAVFRPHGPRPEGAPDTYRGVLLAPSAPRPGARGEDGARGASADGETRGAARLPPDGAEAAKIVARVEGGAAQIESVTTEKHAIPAPRLYDLTELQRHANRLYGMSAQRTLDVTQSLYEKKLVSYPRTDSRHLSTSVAAALPAIVLAIEGEYRAHLAPSTGAPLGRRFVDDAQVTDHHAILPTATRARTASLSTDERRVYDLVCRRLLSAWHEDHVYATTHVVTAVTSSAGGERAVDRFATSGTAIERVGWKALDVARRADQGAEPTLPPGLAKGARADVASVKAVPKRTRPPPRYTDATLLTAMESAGRTIEEKEISEAMRSTGLGTPATRASTLETLLRREYLARDGKSLSATDRGIALVLAVHPRVKSPILTGEWERELRLLERGQGDFDAFMSGIESFVRDVVAHVAGDRASGARPELAPPRREPAREPSPPPVDPAAPDDRARTPARGPSPPRREPARDPSPPPFDPAAPDDRARAAARGPSPFDAPAAAAAPRRVAPLAELLRDAFGFTAFRPYQEEVCAAVAAGRDVLLVMPTGAGKSLCYQLPGLARGGATLVVSPLIALMEDQVGKLLAQGIAADRIHSGRDRLASRAACRAYLDGSLRFLFIAPERLKVPGFPEMLARRKPTLIAIDEAHCISQWGHDFRPDYRMLGERLPLLRPAPVIALTATATPDVQKDIEGQLALDAPARFIHGFRRENIAIEVLERSPGERVEAAREILAGRGRLPAIVYAATRKHAETAAAELASRTCRTAVYHAGLGGAERDAIQRAFLDGGLDVIVATIAFGMGIDKADVRTVIHAALPATLEGYYQEIGRAGRDGAPARAILFESFVDRKTHEFFLERDYPETAILAKLFDALSARPVSKEGLAARARLEPDVFEKAIEKLWLHGGALVAPDESIRRGKAGWARTYEAQRKHRQAQLEAMHRFARRQECRMLQIVHHFGDERDGGAPCGACDVCAPEACIAQRFREPSANERAAEARVVEALRERDGLTVGQIHRDVFADGSLDRGSLEHLLGALARAGVVTLKSDEFERDGETIAFQRVYLAGAAGERRPVQMHARPAPNQRATRKRAPSRADADGRGRSAKAKAGVPRGPKPAGAKSRRDEAAASRRGDGAELVSGALIGALRAWRLSEASRKGIPAFRVLTDRALLAIASECPHDEASLRRLPGVGDAIVKKYGARLLAIVSRSG